MMMIDSINEEYDYDDACQIKARQKHWYGRVRGEMLEKARTFCRHYGLPMSLVHRVGCISQIDTWRGSDNPPDDDIQILDILRCQVEMDIPRRLAGKPWTLLQIRSAKLLAETEVEERAKVDAMHDQPADWAKEGF